MTDKKLDLEAARKFAAEGATKADQRNTRWKELFTASLEGVAVSLLDEQTDDFEEEDEAEDEDEDAPDAPPTPEEEAERRTWLTGRATAAAEAAAALADAALEIEIERKITP